MQNPKINNDDDSILSAKEIKKLLENSNKKFHNSLTYIQKQTATLKESITENVENDEIRFGEIRDIVKNPTFKTFYPENNLSTEQIDFETYKKPLDVCHLKQDCQNVKKKKVFGIPKTININKKETIVKLSNYYIGENIIDQELVSLIKEKGIKKVLILSDTAYTRHLVLYKKIANKLEELDIPFVEFTHIQPKVTRKMLFDIADFAHDYTIDAVFVVGSDSTIDISKLLLSKLLKPNLIRLNWQKQYPIFSNNFSIFSFPTIVVPDPKINSKSLFKNKIFCKKWNYFGDTIFLSHPIDDSDAIFYYLPYFFEISESKQLEILHEVFFRLIFNYFDIRGDNETCNQIVANIKTINWYAQYVFSKQKLNIVDVEIIMKIIASTVDGSTFIDHGPYWTWYKLEAALSDLVNSKKSDGLALFLPSFIEIYSKENSDFQTRANKLAEKLYGAFSVNGLIYNLIKYIEYYGLPIKLLDVQQVKKIDYKFISYLIRKSSHNFFFGKTVKKIVQNLAVW